MSNIIKLEAENVKRLKAVSITPEGSLVVIGGKNAQGKTSVLDAIQYALGGKKDIAAMPVRKGEEEAKIVLTLDDLVITRIMRPDGKGSLKVTALDGAAYGSPQGILDKLVGNLSFDPLAFSRMDEKAQLATLKGLVGLDTSKIDNDRAAAYAKRTEENRKLDQLRAQYKATAPVEAPDEPVSIAALVDEQTTAQLMHTEHSHRLDAIQRREQRLEESKRDCGKMTERMAELRRELAKLEDEVPKYEKNIGTQIADIAADKAVLDDAEKQLPNLTAISDQIKGAETINRNVAAKKSRAELAEKGVAQGKVCDGLTAKINELDAAKRAAIAAAVYPIDGLAVDDNGITYNGIPFSQSSGAEQLRVSTAMGLAMNPALKVMTIRDGSLLDKDSLALLAKMAEDAGAQVWLEKVSEDAGECSVIIEDGMIKESPHD